MDWYNTIKYYYDNKDSQGNRFYTKEDVAQFVVYGKITKEQYGQIVGYPYPE